MPRNNTFHFFLASWPVAPCFCHGPVSTHPSLQVSVSITDDRLSSVSLMPTPISHPDPGISPFMCFPYLPFPPDPTIPQTMPPSFHGLCPLTRTLQLCLKNRPAKGSFSPNLPSEATSWGEGFFFFFLIYSLSSLQTWELCLGNRPNTVR